MDIIADYLAILFKFLAASLIIERILEYLDRVLNFIGMTSGNRKTLLRLAGKSLNIEEENKRVVTKRLIMQSVAIVAGIIISTRSQLGIAHQLDLYTAQSVLWWDVILSALLISGGTEPIHNLINFLKGKKDEVKQQRIAIESEHHELLYEEPAIRFDINYEGGIHPNQPGHDLRKNNPRYIVIHHSQTSEHFSFEELVEHIKREEKQGSDLFYRHPAFHSVVTYDGQYHNYCRWDSLGWHMSKAISVSNGNSLAICFTGNYENRSKVAGYNNWDTNPRPSEVQIETGSKVIALWRILYDIQEKHVLPHRKLNRGKTSCPGNNFPVDRLIARSSQLIDQWTQDEQVKHYIEIFKQKKYIYV
ncbi:MAG: hypothetical protein GF313_05365 [Caldithrix sp.]|nr:hypothetical protein [Caldithrix sp.]